MDAPVLALLFIGMLIYSGYLNWVNITTKKKIKLQIENSLKSLNDSNITEKKISSDMLKIVVFDESHKKLSIISITPSEFTTNILTYRDILSVEIFYDGETITKTNRTSQIGGALIGGLALGGLGAVVGGLSGKTTSKKEVNKIELRLIINDNKNPVQDITFLNKKTNQHSSLYKQSEKSVRHWYAIISLLIAEADKEDRTMIKQPIKQDTEENMSDKLEKLHTLFEKGILTQDEFTEAKQKIIGTI